jgi:hypothetical protein
VPNPFEVDNIYPLTKEAKRDVDHQRLVASQFRGGCRPLQCGYAPPMTRRLHKPTVR